jgi:hypothetical protein
MVLIGRNGSTRVFSRFGQVLLEDIYSRSYLLYCRIRILGMGWYHAIQMLEQK